MRTVVTITGPTETGVLTNAFRLKDFPLTFSDCDFPSKGIHFKGGYDWSTSTLSRDAPSNHCRNIHIFAELSDADRDDISFFVTYDAISGERITKRYVGRRVE